MLERFTNQSRRVVVLAQEEARLLNHDYIGTEHLLLGMLHEGRGTAARALTAVDVSLVAVRDQIVAIIGRGQAQLPGHIPFTPRAKKSLELSLREALRLGDGYVGTGHLLLGLLHQGDNVALEMLDKLGTNREDLRARVIQELRDHPEAGPQARVATREQQQLELFLHRDLQGLLDAIDDRLEAIEQHLGITRPAETPLTQERARAEQEEPPAGAAGREAKPTAGAGTAAGTGRAGGAGTAGGEPGELAWLQARVSRLEERLREHGIDPGEPQEPPAAAG